MNTLECIKVLLNDWNLSVYKLSNVPGIRQSTLSNMFNHNNGSSINTLEDICKAFWIIFSQFFANEGELVALNKEQVEMLEKWLTLISEQKTALIKLLK